jgi:hypothetical protein
MEIPLRHYCGICIVSLLLALEWSLTQHPAIPHHFLPPSEQWDGGEGAPENQGWVACAQSWFPWLFCSLRVGKWFSSAELVLGTCMELPGQLLKAGIEQPPVYPTLPGRAQDPMQRWWQGLHHLTCNRCITYTEWGYLQTGRRL